MESERENLKKAREHFLEANREFLLSFLYIIRFVKSYMKKNGRELSPFVSLAEAAEAFINSFLLIFPADGKEISDFEGDFRVLLKAIEELRREISLQEIKFREGSLEFKMWDLINEIAKRISEENPSSFSEKKASFRKRKRVKIQSG